MSTRLSETHPHLLARLWLAEPDADLIAALRRTPGLAEHVPSGGGDSGDGGGDGVRHDLAVAWLDLVSRHVPPHESVFVDPTAMLDAPSTARFRATLARCGWSPPPGLRVPAPDHLGVQLLALADLGGGATAVLTDHLVVWLPIFADALAHADIHPLYAAAARQTLDTVLSLADDLPLSTLPPSTAAVLPILPPRQIFRGNDSGLGIAAGFDVETGDEDATDGAGRASDGGPDPAAGVRLRDILDALLIPRDAGLYLTRTEIAASATALGLPIGMGDRRMMLRGVFEAAGRHDAVAALLDALDARWAAAQSRHAVWAAAHPAWAIYAAAWGQRLAATRTAVAAWRQDVGAS
ncbi:MAG: molecular chaperone TorD family protein [Ardenticatenales bacterium]|nr:molecular chaperone TorD family protein [Ardenticatenales bacterium]